MMDSSGLSGVMEGARGRIVNYKFTCFVSAIIAARYLWRRKRRSLQDKDITKVARCDDRQEKVDL